MQILNFAGIAGALRAISKPQLLIPRLQARGVIPFRLSSQ